MITWGQADYRPDIDGLRAVAVVAVVLYHARLGCPGGFVGVDVFFVISGFLITGLILKRMDEGRFRLAEFAERRIRRIVPVLTVVVMATLAAGYFVFLPADLVGLGKSVVAQALLVANYHYWLISGYFEEAAEMKPLLHTWSLAVEEQFYIVFPLLLIAVRRWSRAALLAVLAVGACLSLGLSEFTSRAHPSVNYYFLPTRAWELLLGAMLAAAPARWRGGAGWLRETVAWAGLAGILIAVFAYGRDTRFPGVSALLPCGGAAALIWANSGGLTSVGRLLAIRPLVFIGLISYSLYLWHWPVLVFTNYARLEPLPPGWRALLMLLCVGLSALSWRYVELPFRKRRMLAGRASVFAFAGACAVVMLAAGGAVYQTHGIPSRMPDAALKFADGYADDYRRVRKASNAVGLREVLDGKLIELGNGGSGRPIDFLLWGDSHAASVIPALDRISRERSVRGVAVVYAGTAPLVGYESKPSISMGKDSLSYSNAVLRIVREKGIENVILVARWGAHVEFSGAARIRAGLLETIAALNAAGARAWIMTEVPVPEWSVPRALAIATLLGKDPSAVGIPLADFRKAEENLRPLFEDFSEHSPNAMVLDPTMFFPISNGNIQVALNGEALYCDGTHLSTAGAMLLKPLFEQVWQRN